MAFLAVKDDKIGINVRLTKEDKHEEISFVIVFGGGFCTERSGLCSFSNDL